MTLLFSDRNDLQQDNTSVLRPPNSPDPYQVELLWYVLEKQGRRGLQYLKDLPQMS